MKTLNKHYPFMLLTLLVAALSAAGSWYAFAPDHGLRLARMQGYFPNTALTTHDNRPVRFYDDLVKDKTVLINFTYTSCGGICPQSIAAMRQVKKLLSEEEQAAIDFYSITLDPTFDTPNTLRRYAESVGADWTFLTGEYDDIERLRYRLGVYDPDPIVDADRSQHGGILVYGNESIGRWAAIPVFFSPERIARALRLALDPTQRRPLAPVQQTLAGG